MDDEQKQNVRKKRKHDTEANVHQPNIAQITEGILPQHAPLPEESSAATTQNVATNTVVPIQNADPMMPRPINNSTRNRMILNSSATYVGDIARLHIPRMRRSINNSTRNETILNSSATYLGHITRQGQGIHIPRMPRPINHNQLMLDIPEEQSASNSWVQGQSSTSSDTDTNLQTEPTPTEQKDLPANPAPDAPTSL